MDLDITFCAVPVTFLVALFGTIILVRWFKHREIMALVEKGIMPAQYAEKEGRRGLLGWGVTLTAVGLALMLGLWPIGFVSETPFPLGFGPWMLAGLIPLFIGLGFLIIYFLTRKEEPPADEALLSQEEAASED